MTIQEAIKSGKRFRRKAEKNWRERIKPILPDPNTFHLGYGGLSPWITFTEVDVLATDWEIEEQKIEITRELLQTAFKACFKASEGPIFYQVESKVAKELGFKD